MIPGTTYINPIPMTIPPSTYSWHPNYGCGGCCCRCRCHRPQWVYTQPRITCDVQSTGATAVADYTYQPTYDADTLTTHMKQAFFNGVAATKAGMDFSEYDEAGASSDD